MNGMCTTLAFLIQTRTGAFQNFFTKHPANDLWQGICCVSRIHVHLILSYLLRLCRQQAISGLTQLPADVFEGSGQVFHKFGLF